MPLPILSCIAEANIESREVRYVWDEWASKKSIYRREGDAELRELVRALSQRGRIALAAGIAEWLVCRFRPLLYKMLPFYALEAAWAGVVDRRYVLPLPSFADKDKDEWSGPVMGVIRRGLGLVNDTIDLGWANGDTARIPVKITNLTRYVLPDTRDFTAWVMATIERLRALSPLEGDDFVGEVVPREALDCRHDFDPQTIESSIQRFLGEISSKRNPYLASRETMLEWGFYGEPYTFDITRDRQTRRK